MLRLRSRIADRLLSFVAVTLIAGGAGAQSTRIDLPTPIRTNQVTGQVTPLDIGDPRLTQHFYTFFGTPGDLTLTAISKGLNGNIDVFAAGTLRPVMAISLLASDTASSVTKTVFLHEREPMILRVEARTIGDDPGSYTISFVGSFEPYSGVVAEDTDKGNEKTAPRAGRKVSSVGANIPEPPSERAAEVSQPSSPPAEAATQPTPQPSVNGNEPDTSGTAAEKPKTATSTNQRPQGRRTTRGTRGTARPGTRRTPGRPAATENTEPATTNPPADTAGPRLVIELKDGTLFSRPMNTVRRVTIDNAVVVVINANGRVERFPMSNVVRMGVENKP